MRFSRWLAWGVLAVAIVVTSVVLSLRGSSSEAETNDLPSDAEAERVASQIDDLPGGDRSSAVVVYSRGGQSLTETDLQTIREDVRAFSDLASGRVIGPTPSSEKQAATVVVPFETSGDNDALESHVEDLRAEVERDLPDGLSGEVTGAAAFAADLGKVFEGADVRLLGATVLVVALLLLITYRSPFLWIVPLVVVGAGDQVAASAINILARAGLPVGDPSTSGIASVLVFGAGTNYALLLVARYREALRQHEDRFVAMRAALRSAAPAIAASAGTVGVSLLMLLAATLPFNRAIGIAGALGIAIALLYGLVVLPAALVVFGRWLFWPFVPHVGTSDPTKSGLWSRIANAVTSRPRRTLVAGFIVLAALATGLATMETGLSQTEQFRAEPESVQGQQTLDRFFESGASQPLTITTDADTAKQTADVAADTPGVADVRPDRGSDELATFSVVVDAPPGTPASDDTIRGLRDALDQVSTDTLVGGQAAADYDTAVAAEHDQSVVIPLVLVVVAIFLGVLLRSICAPVLLIATVVASYFSALGSGWLVFRYVLDYPALDVQVSLLAFLFLVALGVDYNIFLVTRARQEAVVDGTRRGIVTALSVTGGVITAAGILLAAVFTVLGVLPLVLLGQLGAIVGIGVLLDTLVVRTLVVPALIQLVGERFWWPSRPGGWR